MKQLKLNLRLDSVIYSDSISASFNKEVKPFSPNEYCLPFFDFLNIKKNERLDLFELIDNFIDHHKNELSWQDIVITASGATRCKTNLRFALNQLRGIGLIKKVDQNGKRVFLPTLEGELVFYTWRLSLNNNLFKPDLFSNELAHFLKIKDGKFHVLYDTLGTLTLNNVNTIEMIEEFKKYRIEQDLNQVAIDFTKNIKQFLKDSIITENGIFIKGNRN